MKACHLEDCRCTRDANIARRVLATEPAGSYRAELATAVLAGFTKHLATGSDLSFAIFLIDQEAQS
jgi:hypothetical protein